MLTVAEPYLEKEMHPTVIIRGFFKALEDALDCLSKISLKVDTTKRDELLKIIQSCIGTKFTSRWSSLMCNLALDAVATVVVEDGDRKDIDIKRYVKVEKVLLIIIFIYSLSVSPIYPILTFDLFIVFLFFFFVFCQLPGGELVDSYVLKGVMLNKDVLHSKMRRRIENPRILLLDCPIEYVKSENATSVEVEKEEDWTAVLRAEENYIKRVCDQIIALKPDLVITEKGISGTCYPTKLAVIDTIYCRSGSALLR